MQVQEDISEHHHDAIAAVARRRMAEYALPNLRAAYVLTDGHELPLDKDVGIAVVPLTEFALEFARLVNDDLAVVGFADGIALQRPGGGPLEIDACDLEAAAVTGALKLLFRFQ